MHQNKKLEQQQPTMWMYPKNPSTTLRNDRNAHSRFVKCSGNPATCPCDVSASPTHTATGENGNFKTLVCAC